jgi:hypothetical protein
VCTKSALKEKEKDRGEIDGEHDESGVGAYRNCTKKRRRNTLAIESVADDHD